MADGQYGKKRRRDDESHAPGMGNVAVSVFQNSGEHHDDALAEDGCNPVESASDSDIYRLPLLVERNHVETVCRDVVSRGCEGNYVEKYQRQPVCIWPHRKGKRSKAGGHDSLHCKNPPALGADNVNEGAPQWLDDPWEI